MVQIKRRVTIERPVEVVFDLLADASNDVSWNPSVVLCEQITDGPVVPGTLIREVRRFLGQNIESVSEVTAHDPFTKMAFKMASGPVPYAGLYTFTPLEGSTILDIEFEVHPGGIFALAEPLVAKAIENDLEKSLERLKELLESEII